MLKIALPLLAMAFLGHASKLKTPENQWVKPGDSTVLKCEAMTEVTSCSWSTAYGEVYLMGTGNTAENGRLSYASTDKNECAIKVDKIETKDHGKWTCLLGFTNGNEVTSERGNFNVNLATRPSSITLQDPFDKIDLNGTDAETNQFRCIVENAIPKPVFHWYVDDEKLSDIKVKTTEEENTYTQTLYYEPKADHLNKTLRCVIDHAGFEFEDEREDAILLKFTEDILDIIKNTETNAPRTPPMDVSTYFIIIMSAVLLLCLLIFCFVKGSNFCVEPQEADVEKNNPGSHPGSPEKPDSEAEKTDATKDETAEEKVEEVKKSLGERFSSFFRVKKSFTIDEKESEDVVEEGENIVEEPVETILDNKDVADEKEPETVTTTEMPDEKDASDQVEKKEKSASRFMVFMSRMLKGRDIVADKAEEKPISMTDLEKGEEKEIEKSAIIELEPEDKAEKEVDNKEVEQKPTPNTSF